MHTFHIFLVTIKAREVFLDSMSDDVTDMYPFIRGNEINNKVKGFLSNFSSQNLSFYGFIIWTYTNPI